MNAKLFIHCTGPGMTSQQQPLFGISSKPIKKYSTTGNERKGPRRNQRGQFVKVVPTKEDTAQLTQLAQTLLKATAQSATNRGGSGVGVVGVGSGGAGAGGGARVARMPTQQMGVGYRM